MESVMLRTAAARAAGATVLQASSSQVFVGLPLVRPRSATACGMRRRQRSSSAHITRAALVPLPLPAEFGYVVLTAAASVVIIQWQAILVGAQRRKAGVPYPKMYEDAERSVFNCYQRAHQNTLEAYPSFLALLTIGGLGYPVTSSVFGVLWCVGRVVYSLGYFTGDPKNRMRGMFHFFALMGLLGTCVVLGVRQTGLLSFITS